MLPLHMLTLEVESLSYIIRDAFGLHTGELWSFFNHFWQRADAMLQDVSVAEQLFNGKLLISD